MKLDTTMMLGCLLAAILACGCANSAAAPPAGTETVKTVATCETVAIHVVALMRAEVKRKLTILPPQRWATEQREFEHRLDIPAMVAECQRRAPSQPSLRCALDAERITALTDCKPRAAAL